MSKKKVLLVDDESDLVDTLAERLEIRGFSTRVSYDGESALSLLQSETLDMMVLDLRMPGIDGVEVLREVNRNYPHIAVVVLTGHGSEKDREECIRLGAFDYLNKPTDIRELAKILHKAEEGME